MTYADNLQSRRQAWNPKKSAMERRVLAVLTNEPMTAREVRDKVGFWTTVTIWECLNQLAREGVIIRERDDGYRSS